VKRTIVLAAAALVTLGACTGQPNAKAVAVDMVESLDLPAEQRECMLAELDNYSNSELEAIGNDNSDVNFDTEDPVAQADEAFQKFVADLAACG
jgi:hypothetical protein